MWLTFSHKTRFAKGIRSRPASFRPGFERLEDRSMLSMLAVTSPLDDAMQRGTLRYAVAHAQSGDTILLTPAIKGSGITLTHGELLLGQQRLTIASMGNAPVTISGGGMSRIFEVASGASVTLSNLNITGGNGFAANHQPESHPGRGGGAVVDLGASLTVSGSTFIDNTVDVAGGGIENFGTLAVSGSSFTGNSANFGGGIFNLSSMTGSNITLRGNSAATSGGGLYNGGILTASALTVSDNSAIYGGGIYSSSGVIYNSGSIMVSDSTVSDNSASFGGGVYNYTTATATISNTALTGNTALGSGGGIESLGTLALSNGSTLTNNFAQYYGGGIANFFGTVAVSGAALTFNSAFAGGGISNWANGGFDTPSLSISNSDISHNTASGSGDLFGYGIGGGIFNQSGDVSIGNCTVDDNAADYEGGGVYSIVGGNFTISGGSVSGNSAQYGGGIYNVSAMTINDGCMLRGNTASIDGGGIDNVYNLAIDHCSLSGNTAGIRGGGIYNISIFGDTGTIISSSTLSGNSAQYGGGIYNRNAMLLVTDSIFSTDTPDSIFGPYTDGGGNMGL